MARDRLTLGQLSERLQIAPGDLLDVAASAGIKAVSSAKGVRHFSVAAAEKLRQAIAADVDRVPCRRTQ